MKHYLSLYLILSICVGVTSISILHHAKKPSDETAQPKNPINSFVIDATYTQYNKDGEIKTTMTTRKATHYESTGETQFEKPYIIMYTEKRIPWHIHADQAIADKTGDRIILQGHVVVHELSTSRKSGTILKTSQLTLFPKQSRAMTKQSVTLTRPGIEMRGVGFEANLKTGQYQLHSESEVVYQPQQATHGH